MATLPGKWRCSVEKKKCLPRQLVKQWERIPSVFWYLATAVWVEEDG